jgi:hypothetical protein
MTILSKLVAQHAVVGRGCPGLATAWEKGGERGEGEEGVLGGSRSEAKRSQGCVKLANGHPPNLDSGGLPLALHTAVPAIVVANLGAAVEHFQFPAMARLGCEKNRKTVTI